MSEYILIKFKANGKAVTKIHCNEKHLSDGRRELARIEVCRKGQSEKIGTGRKLRRFCKRLRREFENVVDSAVGHIVGSEKAASLPYIGEEQQEEPIELYWHCYE